MARTKQRRRELARAKWERQQARRAPAARRRRVTWAAGALAAVLAAVVVVAWAFWLPDEQEPNAAAAGSCQYTITGETGETGGTGGTGDGDGVELPPSEPEAAASATMTINGDPITVELLADQAPCTVNSLVHLAAQDYFDDTPCHRVTTSAALKVLQCGDPTGSGTAGPGYQFGLENVDGATYPAGTVAMARSAGDPQSNGSQFFLVYEDSDLPPDYTVFGKITEGLETVAGIAERGTADGSDDGEPAEPVILDDVVTHTRASTPAEED